MDEFYERREQISAEVDALLEKDTLTEEEETQYNDLIAEDDTLMKRIERAREQEKRKASLDKSQNEPIRPDPEDGEDDTENRSSGVRVGQEPGDRPFDSLIEQMRAMKDAALNSIFDPRLRRLAYTDDFTQRAAGTGSVEATGAYGGFLLDTEVAAGVLKRMYDNNQVLNRCTRRTITTNANSVEIRAVNETSRADGSRFGGVRCYWKNEIALMTATRPTFRTITFEPFKLTGMYYASDEILEDVPMLAAEVDDMFRMEMAFKIQDALINGDGSGKPLGVIPAPCVVTQAATSGQGASTFIYDNVTDMWARLWGEGQPNSVWFINQSVYPQLFEMSLAVGTGGAPVFMPPSGASGVPYATLFARPIIPLEQCQALGTAGDVILADMSQYYVVDKGGVDTASSIHLKFDYNQTAFRWTYRIDGRPIWNSALTPFKGSSSNTISPFIILNSTRT